MNVNITYPFSDLLGGVGGFLHATLSFSTSSSLLLKFIDITENFVLVTLEVLPVRDILYG